MSVCGKSVYVLWRCSRVFVFSGWLVVMMLGGIGLARGSALNTIGLLGLIYNVCALSMQFIGASKRVSLGWVWGNVIVNGCYAWSIWLGLLWPLSVTYAPLVGVGLFVRFGGLFSLGVSTNIVDLEKADKPAGGIYRWVAHPMSAGSALILMGCSAEWWRFLEPVGLIVVEEWIWRRVRNDNWGSWQAG